MQREIKITRDGSTTIYLPELNESYHSKHGAIQEAYHVFIKNGLSLIKEKSVSILEIGFGTGLNAFITYLEAERDHLNIDYVGVEAYPVLADEIIQMNYVSELKAEAKKELFAKMHQVSLNEKHHITSSFHLTKRKQLFQEINDVGVFDLIYYDAFGFTVQPELWSEELFKKMYQALKPGGILVTYACRTSIKNAMLSSGFSVQKLPGAPGKREMLRAQKL